MKNIKEIIVTVVAVLLIQVSAQNERSLYCFECHDCNQINITTQFHRNCYGPDTTPTRVTEPSTISLTATTTTVAGNQQGQNGQTQSQVTSSTTQQPQQDNVNSFRNQPPVLFSCFAMRTIVGDRSIVSRGCALNFESPEETCRVLNQGENPDLCQLCDGDTCNSQNVSGVGKLFSSLTLILAFFLIVSRLS